MLVEKNGGRITYKGKAKGDKMMEQKINLSLLLVSMLVACATPAKYDKMLQSWVGKNEAALEQSWGAPSGVKYLEDGEKVITYTKAEDVYVPSEFYVYNQGFEPSEDVIYSPFVNDYDFSPFTQTFGYEVENYCQTSFYIKNGTITGWKWKGNDCIWE